MRDHINEHDMTKKMMDIIRGGYKKNLITEQDTDGMNIRPDPDPQKDTITVKQPNKEPIAKDASGNETKQYTLYKKYEKELESILGPSIEIDSFIIYKEDKNAILTGTIMLDGNTKYISFELNAKSQDVKSNSNNISGNEDNDIKSKLTGYFEDWKKSISEDI